MVLIVYHAKCMDVMVGPFVVTNVTGVNQINFIVVHGKRIGVWWFNVLIMAIWAGNVELFNNFTHNTYNCLCYINVLYSTIATPLFIFVICFVHWAFVDSCCRFIEYVPVRCRWHFKFVVIDI